jgi:hypothetical protein
MVLLYAGIEGVDSGVIIAATPPEMMPQPEQWQVPLSWLQGHCSFDSGFCFRFSEQQVPTFFSSWCVVHAVTAFVGTTNVINKTICKSQRLNMPQR